MTPTNPPSLTSRLRQSISVEHDAIEKTPFSVALISGRLERSDYALNLSQMYHVHETLENFAGSEPALRAFFSDAMRRAGVIRNDLRNLGFETWPLGMLAETEQIVQGLVKNFRECPVSLIGAIYVLEGSRMGSLVLARPLAQSLRIEAKPGSGIDYHIDGARETPMRLKLWKATVDAAGFSPPVETAIEHCAVELMRGLLALYGATPSQSSRRQVA